MSNHEIYDNPLIGRYSSRQMARLWSPEVKFSTWRRLWTALAEAQRALGLPISDQQVRALRRVEEAIDFEVAEAYERRFRHDVMAHIHALADAAAPGSSDYSSGRDELLRDGQYRPDLDPRGA